MLAEFKFPAKNVKMTIVRDQILVRAYYLKIHGMKILEISKPFGV